MYYVIKVTAIGPQIKECFISEELAIQYTTVLSKNNSNDHYRIAKVVFDTKSAE